MLRSIPAVLIVFLLASATSSHAYMLGNDVIDDGGTKMTSGSYVLRGSFGQTTIGKISSGNYVAYIGFWHPYPAGPGIEEDQFFARSVPVVFSLSQNYPNPVTTRTTIQYALPREGSVDMRVYNSAGQQVRALVQENQRPGYYRVTWNLEGVSSGSLPNGIYFYRIAAGHFISTRKMVVLR